jgi:hypothetical protein
MQKTFLLLVSFVKPVFVKTAKILIHDPEISSSPLSSLVTEREVVLVAVVLRRKSKTCQRNNFSCEKVFLLSVFGRSDV